MTHFADFASCDNPVVAYYEKNTPFFVRFGEGRGDGHIHRGIWAPGVTSAGEAMNYVYARVHQRLLSFEDCDVCVTDLGCGVGAGLRYLANRMPFHAVGISISPSQIEIAQALNAAAELDAAHMICGDFAVTPLPPSNLMFAVESLAHARDIEPVLAKISAALKDGGELVVCDDFLTWPYDSLDSFSRRSIDCVREGWRISSLDTFDLFNQRCHSYGLELVVSEDWTPFLNLTRLRDKWLAGLMRAGGALPIRHPLWMSWRAGDTLRDCLQQGLSQYRYGVWRKVAEV